MPTYKSEAERVGAYRKTPRAKELRAIARQKRKLEDGPSTRWVKVKAKPLITAMALWR